MKLYIMQKIITEIQLPTIFNKNITKNKQKNNNIINKLKKNKIMMKKV